MKFLYLVLLLSSPNAFAEYVDNNVISDQPLAGQIGGQAFTMKDAAVYPFENSPGNFQLVLSSQEIRRNKKTGQCKIEVTKTLQKVNVAIFGTPVLAKTISMESGMPASFWGYVSPNNYPELLVIDAELGWVEFSHFERGQKLSGKLKLFSGSAFMYVGGSFVDGAFSAKWCDSLEEN